MSWAVVTDVAPATTTHGGHRQRRGRQRRRRFPVLCHSAEHLGLPDEQDVRKGSCSRIAPMSPTSPRTSRRPGMGPAHGRRTQPPGLGRTGKAVHRSPEVQAGAGEAELLIPTPARCAVNFAYTRSLKTIHYEKRILPDLLRRARSYPVPGKAPGAMAATRRPCFSRSPASASCWTPDRHHPGRALLNSRWKPGAHPHLLTHLHSDHIIGSRFCSHIQSRSGDHNPLPEIPGSVRKRPWKRFSASLFAITCRHQARLSFQRWPLERKRIHTAGKRHRSCPRPA